MQFIYYPKCSTCQRALKHLQALGENPTLRDIRQETPTAEELLKWKTQSGLPWRRFYNTSGQSYRSLGLKDRLDTLTDEEHANLLASDGMLIKRPLLVDEQAVLLGHREAEYDAWHQQR